MRPKPEPSATGVSQPFAGELYDDAMTRILVGALLLVAVGMAAVHRLDGASNRGALKSMTATPAPTPVSASPSARNLVLTKKQNGHFEVEARIDGRRLEFLVDTGASHIAIRQRDAARLGIFPRPSDFTVRVNTAWIGVE